MELSSSLKYEQLLYLIGQLPDKQFFKLKKDIETKYFLRLKRQKSNSEKERSEGIFDNYLGVVSNIWETDAQDFINDLRSEDRF